MATLPATGAAISMGKVQQAYNNVTAGTGADAPTGSRNVKLSAVLGVNYGGKALGAQISFSNTFGGKTGTPYGYTP
jgi:hypothetical protein